MMNTYYPDPVDLLYPGPECHENHVLESHEDHSVTEGPSNPLTNDPNDHNSNISVSHNPFLNDRVYHNDDSDAIPDHYILPAESPVPSEHHHILPAEGPGPFEPTLPPNEYVPLEASAFDIPLR